MFYPAWESILSILSRVGVKLSVLSRFFFGRETIYFPGREGKHIVKGTKTENLGGGDGQNRSMEVIGKPSSSNKV